MTMKIYEKNELSALLNGTQLQEYLQMGRDRSREIAEKANSIVHFGRSVRYSRKKIDSYLESIAGDR